MQLQQQPVSALLQQQLHTGRVHPVLPTLSRRRAARVQIK